jgi:hypothetical protein
VSQEGVHVAARAKVVAGSPRIAARQNDSVVVDDISAKDGLPIALQGQTRLTRAHIPKKYHTITTTRQYGVSPSGPHGAENLEDAARV